MHFEIDGASRHPIYQQLVQQVREAMARGDLLADQQLPSVRQLSRDLVINPNTVRALTRSSSVRAWSTTAKVAACSSPAHGSS